MDYGRLLSLADRANAGRGDGKRNAAISMASGKKSMNASKKPDPMAVARFLASKKREEYEKAEEMRKNKERLLHLRKQNTKANKAAKMMATRTKDNDFSRIVLNDDQIREKNAIEEKLRRQRIDDPKERMKQRIEMEAEAQNSPKKRKRRKSEYGRYPGEDEDNTPQVDYRSVDSNPYREDFLSKPSYVKPKPAVTQRANTKLKKAAPPPLDFNKLLQIAEQKEKEEKKPSLLEEIESAKSMQNDFKAKRIEMNRRAEEQQKENLRRLNAKEAENKAIAKEQQEKGSRASLSKQSKKEPIPNASGYSKSSIGGKYQRDSIPKSNVINKKQPVIPQKRVSSDYSEEEEEEEEEETDYRFSSSRATLLPQKSELRTAKSAPVNKLPIKKPVNSYETTRTAQQKMAYKRDERERNHELAYKRDERIPMKKPETAVRPTQQRYAPVDTSYRESVEEYRPTKVNTLKATKYPEYVPSSVNNVERYSPENEYEKRLKKQKSMNNNKPQISYKPSKIVREESDDDEEEIPRAPRVTKAPVDKNKYIKESLNPYERNRKQQQMMSRQRDEYSPEPFKKSNVRSKTTVEEYSPTEPYMNGKKKATHLKPKEPIPPAKYKPTSRQEIVKYSRESESPEPEPRRSIHPQYEQQKKKLPIGATYKKNARPASPVYEKQADITTHRVLNNSSFSRLTKNMEKDEPPDTRAKMSRTDITDELIKKNVQRVMQKPRCKLPPIGLNYRRGMYGEKNDIEYEESVEDEEDDEMRDFIDDGEYADVMDDDYSKYIREIFGYDKRKYVDEDDEDEAMEASFDQQQREELRSAKIGILEDLRDMKMEAEEKRRKALLRKRRQIIDDDDDDDDDDEDD